MDTHFILFSLVVVLLALGPILKLVHSRNKLKRALEKQLAIKKKDDEETLYYLKRMVQIEFDWIFQKR